MNVSLVEDKHFGDSFNPPDVGTPVYFKFADFTFNGLLQSYQTQRSFSGAPVYEVIIVDPRELLAGAQLIVGGYSGSVNVVPNILNVFGYYENLLGFGGSQSNEAGMPWHLIKSAVGTITNSVSQTAYGGPLLFKGYSYKVDLSEIPSGGNLYRLGGGSISMGLLEAIEQVCTDAGCDYYVVLLNNGIIKVKVVSRFNQPPLGTISNFVNNATNVVSSQAGLELRNETTSAFILGGPVQALYLTSDIYPVWGFHPNGLPILGKDTDNDHVMQLNASSISDIIGSVSYNSSIREMRLALYDENMWRSYVKLHKPALADMLDLSSDIVLKLLVDYVNVKEQAVNLKPINDPDAAFKDEVSSKIKRVYEFVRKHAEEFYGRKFLVKIAEANIKRKVEPETNRVVTNWEVTDGGYLPEGAQPLGLESEQADLFQTEDGRFVCFVRYTKNIDNYELDKVNPSVSFIQLNDKKEPEALFVKAQADPQIYWINNVPYILVTIAGQPLQIKGVGTVVDLTELATALAKNENEFNKYKDMFKRLNKNSPAGDNKVGIANVRAYPTAIAVPLKSNVLTYGPWYGYTTTGKVRVEQDSSLVPWQYNGYSLLNTAGKDQVFGSVTNMQSSESGRIELEGPPTKSLGDVLTEGGPNLTNIDITYDISAGVKTVYRFETYTPRFGSNGQVQQRLRRLAKAQTETARNLKRQRRDAVEFQASIVDANKAVWESFHRKFRHQTLHECLIGNITDNNDPDAEEDEKIVGVSTGELTEVVNSMLVDDATAYKKQAAMSLNGLLRPFSTDPEDEDLPHYVTPVEGASGTVKHLNPFQKGHDIAILAHGDEMPEKGLDARWGAEAPDNVDGTPYVRPIGLKGPLVIVGWGYDINGNLVPSD
jgi:hypothetical protein